MKTKKHLATIICTVLCTLTFTLPVFAGVWQHDGYGWWYRKDDGSCPKSVMTKIDGEWYAFDKYGYMKSNEWVMASGQWHYCTGNGVVARNQWIEGKYYVGDEGVMLTNTWTPDGYWVDETGTYDPSKGQKGNSADIDQYITMDGNWDNRDQSGYSKDRRVDCWIELRPDEVYMGTMNFGLYMSSGTPYDLYDDASPNGDSLSIATVDGLNWSGRSEISGKWYDLTYNGKDEIILNWRTSGWTSSGRLVFKRRSGGSVFRYWSGGGVG